MGHLYLTLGRDISKTHYEGSGLRKFDTHKKYGMQEGQMKPMHDLTSELE